MTEMSLTDDLEEYGAALTEGRMLVRHCDACNNSHHYPRSYCPLCGSDQTRWRNGSGRGQLYSFTVWRRRGDISMPAMVTIEEGPTLLATIVAEDPALVSIGAALQLLPSPGGLPRYGLATAAPIGDES